MKLATLQVSIPSAQGQSSRDYPSPDIAKYRIEVEKQAPALHQEIDSLPDDQRQRYDAAFAEIWNNRLDPTARQMILAGAAGGVGGASLATLSLPLISKAISRDPLGYIICLTVLGVAIGTLTPEAATWQSGPGRPGLT